MGALRRTPHTIQVIRPTASRDANTGATSLDYGTPVTDRQVRGFVSTRGGTMSTGDEGQLVPFDAVFFTRDTVIAADDQVILSFSWLTGKFLVVGTEPKAGTRGGFDHNEVLLQKDQRR